MIISPVPAFQDNYIWLLKQTFTPMALIIDPGQSAPVLSVLQQQALQPLAILITHHHRDHVGGIAGLLARYPQLPVFGPAQEMIPHRTQALHGGEALPFPALGITVQVLAVPGHTAGHIAYFIQDIQDTTAEPILFCGDTLFGAGCGRVFDGSLSQLHQSLMRLAQLPDHTAVYCAHEYTLDNIGFAKWVEPDNPALLAREQAAEAAQQANLPTVPSTIALERATNPFLRTHEPAVIACAERQAQRPLQDAAAVFAVLRQWKDQAYD